MAVEEQLCRQELDRKVEEARLRKGLSHSSLILISAADYPFLAMLSPLHSDKGNQLQQHLHLSRASQAAQGGPSHPVRQLRMPRMWKQRLNDTAFASSPATMHHAQRTTVSRRAQAPASSIALPAEKQRRPMNSRHITISPPTTSHIGPPRRITVDF